MGESRENEKRISQITNLVGVLGNSNPISMKSKLLSSSMKVASQHVLQSAN